MFEACEPLVAEYAEIEGKLSTPEVHKDQNVARRLGRRFAELRPTIGAYREWQRLGEEALVAAELAAEDAAFEEEVVLLAEQRKTISEKLTLLLVPRDPMDGKDVILEVKAGEGGAESALFAADLLRMYQRYAEQRGWITEMISSGESDLGGIKDASMSVKAKSVDNPDDAPFARLKFEGGVHRVQRVPVTEASGRIHTSAAGVLVMPEAEDVDIEIDPNDLRIDVFRSSGPGGQSVNTTDSAVRITHEPTGVVVSCQNEKSQLQNRESALRILRSRLLTLAREEADKEASEVRRAQVRTVDRSERVRTYNFPENRLSDHRVGFKSHNLDQVLEGELDAVIQALLDADLAARLAPSED
jgi:peptide chain release factor 1